MKSNRAKSYMEQHPTLESTLPGNTQFLFTLIIGSVVLKVRETDFRPRHLKPQHLTVKETLIMWYPCVLN
jgi:hypothetical protein